MSNQNNIKEEFNSLEEIAQKFRDTQKKFIILFAHNGTGKTRLSMKFKELGKMENSRDTLYFNAFTEDLFYWDNDLENDTRRVLKMNKQSKFFDGIDGLDIQNRIRPFLARYADFDFNIDTTNWEVSFARDVIINGNNTTIENIKVSRGEENIFIWCFFLAIVQITIDNENEEDETIPYKWVKYIYIDDPISSLDDNNVITVASHLAQLLKNEIKKQIIISTHHGLFYNVLFNELKKANKYLLIKYKENRYLLEELNKDTPYYQHIGIIKELKKVANNDRLYTYHFNLLRNILEKTAAFHGFDKFSDCIKKDDDDIDDIIHSRRINILSHGNYSIFEPIIMQDENKEHFNKILDGFLKQYNFNDELFNDIQIQEG